MATIANLKDRIFRLTSHRYNDTFHMLDLINSAQGELVEGARLRDKQTISVVQGTASYALPNNFKSPGVVQDESNECVVLYDLVDISENLPGYAIEGGSIVIKPTPSNDLTLTHYYYKYPATLVDDSDIPEIDEPYHDLLAVYAAGMILLLPELTITDKTLSDRLLKRWDEGKFDFIASMQRKNKSAKGRTVTNW